MKAHELAKKLLDGPDEDVLVWDSRNAGYTLAVYKRVYECSQIRFIFIDGEEECRT